ncbi:MAG: peptide-methionine (S)-S-oxide reductase MsrA [Actinomycetota bacterium]|nr:peptide-methionine (S)-S-oxide reductase MsrA [Actinomycetota bacterium]
MERATFAAGCFWGVQAELDGVLGVVATRAGYTGGEVDGPSYEQVGTGRTGHAEAVELEFDPARVAYEELVERFFALHDPTQRDGQGRDLGPQYRSAVFVHGPEQERVARQVRDRVQAGARREVVTEILPAGAFWPAEEHHQRYLEKRGLAACGVPAEEF